ncbi:tRNA(Ile)-lysidine synthase [Candidatus Bartonella washoeensis]|uniref:tRNA(Ile)-lysidine synthase n=1 Tax=Candidatus Bartonella washoeensis Sb944nv TaxID=1094563 RepID=J0Q4C0_9HYPH|nr:tRNA lysidine(34) synthetase TilS [Bartonella washoeensis]EJF79966.1 tRNA(Ile)-lysidine synthase [Bartonella washoeensis Sb944nv]SPU26078.1 tRNA(Ile)-lysidine synthase [Bartonella washoeensis]
MLVRLAGNLFKTSDFIECRKLILAVSGGSDSLALLFLVKEHLKTLSVPPEMIVVTVDHQLRRESAREALTVAEICHAHHIKHIIVQWEGKKPKTHIASSARVARYDLLFQEAQKQGATLIMTGHTLNDQVETYQMRCQRLQKNAHILQQENFESMHDGICARDRHVLQQATWENKLYAVCPPKMGTNIAEKSCGLVYERGLSCIPREALLRRAVRLIRPLLGVKRETLQAYLRLKGKTWIDDPTNEDRNFERVRVRQSLHQKKLADIAKKVHEAALQRRQKAQNIADLILALDINVEYGRCFIAKPAPFLQQHPDFPFVLGLFTVLMGGGGYLLPLQKLIALFQKLCLHSAEKKRFTLAGSVIEYNRKGEYHKSGIAFWRESRNLKEAIVAPRKTLIWDGRYQVTNHGSKALKVGPAGLEQLKSLCKKSSFDLERPHYPSLQSLLMISNDKGYDIPELTHHSVLQQNVTIKRIMAPFEWLLSHEDAPFINIVEHFFNIEAKR